MSSSKLGICRSSTWLLKCWILDFFFASPFPWNAQAWCLVPHHVPCLQSRNGHWFFETSLQSKTRLSWWAEGNLIIWLRNNSMSMASMGCIVWHCCLSLWRLAASQTPLWMHNLYNLHQFTWIWLPRLFVRSFCKPMIFGQPCCEWLAATARPTLPAWQNRVRIFRWFSRMI